MKQRSLPFESGFRSFQRGVSWFMPEDCDRETAEAFKLRTIISVSLLVGTSGFPFMLLFFFMQHPREGFVVLWSWLFFTVSLPNGAGAPVRWLTSSRPTTTSATSSCS